ncbi:MAG: cytochrome C assembly family protein [Enterobacteriaceae bacterium]
MPLFAIIAILAYSLSLALIIPAILRKSGIYRHGAIAASVIALLCHGLVLYQRIFDIGIGQNLSLLNVASAVSLLICVIMTVPALLGRGWFLLPIVYSFAIINLVLASLLPGEFITHLENSPVLLFHIALALFAYATLVIAALYALQIAWVDYRLKHKRLDFSSFVPPLMAIERKMFHITQVGITFLTLTLVSGSLFLHNLLQPENLHKMVLSMVTWLLYIVLLWGHYRRGWRGRSVVWLMWLGAVTLTLAYFGNRFIQEGF